MNPSTLSSPRVAYLVNQYPKVSHSFIRREILALERLGTPVSRYAVRGWDDPIADPIDASERTRTRYLLQRGLVPPLRALACVALRTPGRFLAAARLTFELWRRSGRPFVPYVAYLAEAALLLEWLRAEGTTHLHAHFGTNPADVALLVRVLGGPPYSFTVHGPEEFDKPESIGLREKGGRAAFVVAISSYGRSQLYRWLPMSEWARVRVVHCGLEPGFHADAPAVAQTAARLVCVGRLCEQKGQLLLLSALRQVVARGVPVQLVLAGDGEMRSEIEALVARYQLSAQVKITGWISSEQVREEILAARALVLPSFAEGLPVVIMEAMALRRPVITTYVAGIPELVRDPDNGWLVPAGDVDRLAQAMLECLAAPAEELQRRGMAARVRVLARHDVDTEAGKLAALFSDREVQPASTPGVLLEAR